MELSVHSAATAPMPATRFKRLYYLDALRGLAALSVVFWHWQHFFFQSDYLAAMEHERQPLYFIFKPLYNDGYRAVDLFFCLSGFIFYWLYSGKIEDGKVSGRSFAVLRFSRLYPLHFATLLFVAAAQVAMLRGHGSYFAYPNNDFYHFTLQLFLASSWGFERGPSFDGPIWSVSVEVLLYAIFFVVCALRFRRWYGRAILVAAGFALIHQKVLPVNLIGEGMMYFFIGGLAYDAFRLLRGKTSPRLVLALLALTTALWLYAPFAPYFNFHVPLGHHTIELPRLSLVLLLFPMTILTLALCESSSETLGRRLAFLGDISYSSYLLHFPLQLVFAGITFALAIPNAVFYSPWLLLAFFSVLIPISLASHRWLELPAQRFLRSKFLKPST